MILHAMAGSLQQVLIGFAVGGAIGIPLGLAIGSLPAFDRATRPVLDGLRSIAPIAWIPMAILWLGVRGDARCLWSPTLPHFPSSSAPAGQRVKWMGA
ncbi:MAG: hypothetical protein IPH55_13620 [Betaproteobacteria bacterium]|nr:hypothetical protein [Betaproteobacteria bacterium]